MTDISAPRTPEEFTRYVAGFDPEGNDHDGWEDAMCGLIAKARGIVAEQPPARPPLHIRIITWDAGDQLVADIPDWPYPIPAVGQYLFHPGLDPADTSNRMIAGHVKTVGWRMHDRPAEIGTGFVQTARPYVEIHI